MIATINWPWVVAGLVCGPLWIAGLVFFFRHPLPPEPRCAVCGGPTAAGEGCEFCPALEEPQRLPGRPW